MSRVVNIRPAHTQHVLDRLTSENGLGPFRVISVSVDVDHRRVVVRLSSDETADEQRLQLISNAIKERIGIENSTVEVRWEPEPRKELAGLLEERHDAVMRAILGAVPSLNGWSGAISVAANGNSVEITVPNETLAAAIARKRLRDLLGRSLSECLGMSVGVRVKLGEGVAEPEPNKPRDTPEARDQADAPEPPIAERPIKSVKKQEDNVLLGRQIVQEPVAVKDVQEPEKGCVVEGEVFGVETRALKRGGELLSFCLTDKEDSIAIKAVPKSAFTLRTGDWVRVRGDAAYDKYTEELTISARDIVRVKPRERFDTCEAKRVELHLHTQMSAMDSVLSLREAIKTAKRFGHKAIAITDHGVVQAFPEAHELSEEYGIKIIYGLEGYLVDSEDTSQTPYHVVLLARGKEGLLQLYSLVTKSHMEYFYKRPRILRQDLSQQRSHLLVGSACEAGELYRAVRAREPDDRVLSIASFYDYLEIQPLANNEFLVDGKSISREDLISFNRRIYEIGKALARPVVAAGDVHFVNPEDAIYRRVLLTAQGFEGTEQDSPLFYRTTQEMLDEFAYLGKREAEEVVIKAPGAIADSVEHIAPIPSGFFAPHIPGATESLERIARQEAKRMYGEPLPEIVRERLERELRSISGGGFAGIYAIARELVSKSEQDGYLVGSRGSVGSSFVARLFGITEVNPLPPHYRCASCQHSDFSPFDSVDSGFDLPPAICPECGSALIPDGHKISFEVFMGFKGDKVPDIDLNFSGENQGSVIKFTEDLLGKGSVFRAGTIATVADRTAYGFVKAYCEATGRRLRKAEIDRLARGIGGVKRTTGQHPGGVLVLPEGKQILDFTPLQYPADDRKSGTVTTHFDYNSISSRLVKLDILGHDDPTALRMLHDFTGVDPRNVPFSDRETMSIFSSTRALGYAPSDVACGVGTIGIPEFGTRFVRQMLAETRPKDFSGLVRISGLSHGTGVWLDNAQELIKSGKAHLADVICARDDILNYLCGRGIKYDLAFKIMENVRKGKGVSAEEESLMVRAGVPGWYIDSCKKIQYLFPKAHATAYVMMAFRIAYFKVHMPEAFYAQYLSLRTEDIDLATILAGQEAISLRLQEIERAGQQATPKEKDQATVLEVAHEMGLRGIGILGVSLYESDATRFRILGKNLLPPLVAIPGMGASAARLLSQARETGPFNSVEDLRQRARLQRNIIDLLRKFGCLEGLPECNQMPLF